MMKLLILLAPEFKSICWDVIFFNFNRPGRLSDKVLYKNSHPKEDPLIDDTNDHLFVIFHSVKLIIFLGKRFSR